MPRSLTIATHKVFLGERVVDRDGDGEFVAVKKLKVASFTPLFFAISQRKNDVLPLSSCRHKPIDDDADEQRAWRCASARGGGCHSAGAAEPTEQRQHHYVH